MQEMIIGDHTIKVFASAEELPIKRYSKFQKYSLLETGIGSNMESIGAHFGKLFEYLGYQMNAEALQESKNLYYNFHLMLEEVNIESMAFACLIHSMDGTEITDTSEDGLKVIVELLSEYGLTQKEVESHNSEVKKKSKRN